MASPSTVPLNCPNTSRKMNDSVIMTANATQYVFELYLFMRSGIWTEKYPVIRLTGMNRMVTLARRIVMRVRRSTAADCLRVMRLKFCEWN